MRYLIIALSMLLCPAISVHAQISVDVGLPGINIGINVPAYPELAPMPGYPVYYAPRANSNYFFYDGLYWVYQEDNWYASSWYNGPWQLVGPEDVPLAVLRIPVRYYREPPVYFRGWRDDAPPYGVGVAGATAAELWAAYGAEVTAEWIERHPGTRPQAWWRFDAPICPVDGDEEVDYLRHHRLLTPEELRRLR